MSEEESETLLGFVKGCYRLLNSIAENLVLVGGVLERASGVSPHGARPTQAALPLDDGLPVPGDIARRIAAAPRKWGNAVKVYEILFKCYGAHGFTTTDLLRNADAIAIIAEETKARVGLSSVLRILSALVKCGAATRKGGVYSLRAPTDELREAVERVRNAKGGAK